MSYHKAVLLNECIEGLNINPTGIYVDVTFGGGGHSTEILKTLTTGKLFAFDRDSDVEVNIPKDKNFKLLKTNYKNIKRFLRAEGIKRVDGILADLGVSSHQFDVEERGFSFRFDSELDMRMNKNDALDAKNILQNYSKQELANVFYNYGELRNSRRIADKIIELRNQLEIKTTTQLINCISDMVPEKNRNQFLSQVFQALRIEVNDEIESLKQMMLDGVDILKSEGRFVVLSYHSLEDRIVKNIFKKGNLNGEIEKDFFGNILKNMNEINRKVIVASDKEIKGNSRSRSAKLRVAEKI